jgi:CheY-like chemotaxis protein
MNEIVKRVMLVDDNDTDNFINKKILELTKFSPEIIVKNSGKSALDYLVENQANEESLPNLIFLDINMPIVDGFIFLYEFEQMADMVKNKCKIAILSSSNNKQDIRRIIDNPFVISFVTKPLSESSLQNLAGLLLTT